MLWRRRLAAEINGGNLKMRSFLLKPIYLHLLQDITRQIYSSYNVRLQVDQGLMSLQESHIRNNSNRGEAPRRTPMVNFQTFSRVARVSHLETVIVKFVNVRLDL